MEVPVAESAGSRVPGKPAPDSPGGCGLSAPGGTASARAEPPGTSGPSGVFALLAVFFSPGALFEQLKVRPVFAGALLVGVFLTMLAGALVPADLVVEALRESEAGIPGGERMTQVIKWAGVGVTLPAYALMVLVLAGLLTLTFRFILGDEATFRQYLAVAGHAALITAAGYLLLTPLRITQGDVALSFSLGTFLPFIQGGYLARFLGALDLFTLWSWIVMALGVSVVADGRSWKSATLVILPVGIAFVAIIALIPR
jgi:hypothetical protein